MTDSVLETTSRKNNLLITLGSSTQNMIETIYSDDINIIFEFNGQRYMKLDEHDNSIFNKWSRIVSGANDPCSNCIDLSKQYNNHAIPIKRFRYVIPTTIDDEDLSLTVTFIHKDASYDFGNDFLSNPLVKLYLEIIQKVKYKIVRILFSKVVEMTDKLTHMVNDNGAPFITRSFNHLLRSQLIEDGVDTVYAITRCIDLHDIVKLTIYSLRDEGHFDDLAKEMKEQNITLNDIIIMLSWEYA